jgi:DNA-binding PadR family transcriptional regulator
VARRQDISPQTLAVFRAFIGGGWRHGYDVARETGLSSGTLYPILIRLHGRGLLDARWEERRRSYRLTGEGIVYAEARLAEARPGTATAVAARA